MPQISEASNNSRLRIHIAGQPGSGGTTLATHLEKSLNQYEGINRISGGAIRRAEAFYWQEYSQAHSTKRSLSESWHTFETEFAEIYKTQGYEGIMALLQPYFNRPYDTSVLNDFNQAQKTYSPGAAIWDVVTDAYLIHQTESSPSSYILESKLAVALQVIDQLTSYLQPESAFSLPILKIFLQVDPDVAAVRINIREEKMVTIADVLARREFDWKRYGDIYSSTRSGNPLSEEDLVRESFVINTSKLDPEAVLTEALLFALIQLNEIAYSQPTLAAKWVESLSEILQQPYLLELDNPEENHSHSVVPGGLEVKS